MLHILYTISTYTICNTGWCHVFVFLEWRMQREGVCSSTASLLHLPLSQLQLHIRIQVPQWKAEVDEILWEGSILENWALNWPWYMAKTTGVGSFLFKPYIFFGTNPIYPLVSSATWLPGKSPITEVEIARKITDFNWFLWSIFQQAMFRWWHRRVLCIKTAAALTWWTAGVCSPPSRLEALSWVEGETETFNSAFQKTTFRELPSREYHKRRGYLWNLDDIPSCKLTVCY